MKYIFLNLKRFDIERNLGGVNSLVAPAEWGSHIAGELEDGLGSLAKKAGASLDEFEFPVFFPVIFRKLLKQDLVNKSTISH